MTRQRRPLLLTADPELLDQLLGMAAATGVAVDVAVEPATCGPQWTNAPLVLVGSDLATSVAGARFAARVGVVLVTRDEVTPSLLGVADRVGADDVLGLHRDEAVVMERLADATEPPTRARVIGVIGGRGGAGTSTLAAGLALTAAGHGPSWLIDLDPLGGGADTGLGAELSAGARWPDLGSLTGRLSPHALRSALPEVAGVAVVAAGEGTSEPAPDAVRAVLSAAARGGGTTVLDLGRSPTAARDVAVSAVDDLLLVVPAELRAMIAARRVVASLEPTARIPRVVVRAVPGALPSREVTRGLDLPLAGDLPEEVTVRVAIQTGDPTSLLRGTELAGLCEAVLVVPPVIGVAA
jgi:secretion/DNA translocation related CpaE-like protein